MNDARVLTTLDTLRDGALSELEAVVDGSAESLIVQRDGRTVRAWLNVCPHAGRRLDWAPGQFLVDSQGRLVCAVHGATFDLSGGACVAGPCRGESLRAVPLRIEGETVWIEEAAAP